MGLTALVLEPPRLGADLDGSYEIAVASEVARLEVHEGCLCIVSSGDSQLRDLVPTFIELSQGGLVGILIGTRARHLARGDELIIRGDRGRASRLLDALSSPRVLAGLTKNR